MVTDTSEAKRFSETPVTLYQSRRRNMSHNLDTHFHRCEKPEINKRFYFVTEEWFLYFCYDTWFLMYSDWLRAGRSGIESRWGRDFQPVQTGPGTHPASCKMGTGSFPGVKCGRGMLLTTHPLLVPRSWKSRAIPLPTLWAAPGL